MGTEKQLDMFVVSSADPPLRDNRDAMEYPFLSLQKLRTRPIEFRSNEVQLSVAADVRSSIATIWDWDLIIFAASHLNEAIEAGLEPSPCIKFVPHDALKQLGRGTGGKDYKELANAIRRLRLTTVITNIRQSDDAGEEKPFSWLQSYSIPKRYSRTTLTPHDHEGDPDPSRPWEIELPPWLYNSILRRREVLAVHPDYFQLTGGLERWLYRLARKAVPETAEVKSWRYRMETLHKRSGTTRPLKMFAFDIRRMAEAQPLPEYSIHVERDGKHEAVIIYYDRGKPPRLPRGMKRLEIEKIPAKQRAGTKRKARPDTL